MSGPLSQVIALSKQNESYRETIQKLENAQRELKASHASANRMNDELMQENRRLRDELRELKATLAVAA